MQNKGGEADQRADIDRGDAEILRQPVTRQWRMAARRIQPQGFGGERCDPKPPDGLQAVAKKTGERIARPNRRDIGHLPRLIQRVGEAEKEHGPDQDAP